MTLFLQLSFATVVLAFCHLTVAQVPFPRQCPEVKVMDQFEVDAYMGIWYEYSKYPFIFEIGKKCMYAKYENLGNGTVSVTNTAVNRLTGLFTNITGKAYVTGPARLAVVFSANQSANKPNYLVLGTDYTTYAVVYSCTNVTSYAHAEIVWILTRERKPSPETVSAATKVLTDNNLSLSFLLNTMQDGCPPPKGANDKDTGKEPTFVVVVKPAVEATTLKAAPPVESIDTAATTEDDSVAAFVTEVSLDANELDSENVIEKA